MISENESCLSDATSHNMIQFEAMRARIRLKILFDTGCKGCPPVKYQVFRVPLPKIYRS